MYALHQNKEKLQRQNTSISYGFTNWKKREALIITKISALGNSQMQHCCHLTQKVALPFLIVNLKNQERNLPAR